MNKLVSGGWTSLILMLPLPLLMGAKGGCGGGTVSMGNDYGAEAGMSGEAALAESGRDAGGGGNAAGAGMPAGGKAGQASAGTGGTAAGGSAGAGGKGAQCDGFENTTFHDEVTVRYVNDGDETIYVGRTRTDACDGGFSYDLRNDDGDLLATGGSTCASCELLQSGEPRCPTDCPQGVLVRIEPGGSYEFAWSGTYWQRRNMPTACYGADGFSDCSQLIQAPPGPYHFGGKVWSDVVCGENQGCAPCTPGELGSCLVLGTASVAGTSREVEEILAYPSQKTVELHFD